MAELGSFARQYAESLAQTTGCVVCITDRDSVIAVAGGMKKDYIGKPISKQLETLILNRDTAALSKSDKDFINKMRIVEEEADETAYWLEIIEESELLKADELSVLKKEINELVAMIVASIRTKSISLNKERESQNH